MDIKYTKIKKYNFIEVIDFLINNLSDYKPKLKDYNRIRDSFFKQKNQYTFHESWKPKFHCRKCKTKLEEDLDNMFFCNNCSNYQSIDEITIL